MPKRPVAEFVLALFTGPDRAAAIFGDLAEMAVARGRLWFAATYLRTLFSLTWRPATAFLAGLVSLRMIFWLLFQAFRAPAMQQVPRTPLTVFCAIVVAGTAAPLWFAMPFILIRFGRNDRLARLSAALFLATLPGFSLELSHFSVPLLDAADLTTVAILAVALCSRSWRKAGIILSATVCTGTLALVVFFKILDLSYHLAGLIRSGSVNGLPVELTTSLAMLVAAAVCSHLHNRLHPPLDPRDAHA